MLTASGEQQMQNAQAYKKEAAPVIAQAQAATNAPMPQRPKMQQSPLVPQIQQTANDWMAAAFIFAALGGALVRKNSTASLLTSYMGGMLNGFSTGRDDAIKQEL